MNTTSRSLMLIPAACVLLALTACGNKGPLVMPQKPVPIEDELVPPEDDAAAAVAAGASADAAPAEEGEDQEDQEDGGAVEQKPAAGTNDGNE